MEHPELIQPGDKVFISLPIVLNHEPEEIAEALDAYYPGVEFEAIGCEGLERPEIVFTYRDPRALDRWLAEQKIAEAAAEGVGLMRQHVQINLTD